MIWSNALLLCLVFIWASGEPEPNVNVKINVNVNGESEESTESGISCNLVWNQEEHRPLIMIRENKEIVPPILNTRISDNPNRVPLGLKLVFACPGHSNKFVHIEGNHTKLHGECVEPDRFKVCVNNNPEILELSELYCSRQLFPSFIKQDNATSDKKICDGNGGELYKQGYTYGDFHEFKDLDIPVCFRVKNKTTICTSPNLSGNETDYTAAELQGRDLRVNAAPIIPCGSGGTGQQGCSYGDTRGVTRALLSCVEYTRPGTSTPTPGSCGNYDDRPEASVNTNPNVKWCYAILGGLHRPRDCARLPCGWKPCSIHRQTNIDRCGQHPLKRYDPNTNKIVDYQPSFEWCYPDDTNDDWHFCTNPCALVNSQFVKKHVCDDCDDDVAALASITRSPTEEVDGKPIKITTVFSDVAKNLVYRVDKFLNKNVLEASCKIKHAVKTWVCSVGEDENDNNKKVWKNCSYKYKCVANYAIENGHFFERSLNYGDCIL